MGTPVPMGLTVAIPAHQVPQHDREAAREVLRDAAEQAVPMFRRFIGGTTPSGPLQVKVDGPVRDPIQGMIYGLTIAALVDPDALPADCDAYVTHQTGQFQAVYSPTPTDIIRDETT